MPPLPRPCLKGTGCLPPLPAPDPLQTGLSFSPPLPQAFLFLSCLGAELRPRCRTGGAARRAGEARHPGGCFGRSSSGVPSAACLRESGGDTGLGRRSQASGVSASLVLREQRAQKGSLAGRPHDSVLGRRPLGRAGARDEDKAPALPNPVLEGHTCNVGTWGLLCGHAHAEKALPSPPRLLPTSKGATDASGCPMSTSNAWERERSRDRCPSGPPRE